MTNMQLQLKNFVHFSKTKYRMRKRIFRNIIYMNSIQPNETEKEVKRSDFAKLFLDLNLPIYLITV